jgi:hypothetical protein
VLPPLAIPVDRERCVFQAFSGLVTATNGCNQIKCDNTKPRCRNCEIHDKSCSYVRRLEKPRFVDLHLHSSLSRPRDIMLTSVDRPSNARIIRLEEENRRLQESLSRLGMLISSEGKDTATTPSSSPLTVATRGPSNTPAVIAADLPETSKSLTSSSPAPPVSFSADRESRYHGPTSALFDETSSNPETRLNPTAVPNVPEAWIQNKLLGQTARQRMSRVFHLATTVASRDRVLSCVSKI